MSHLSSTDKPKLRELLAVAIISASVLGLQVALMRTLSISRWHHFAYLVVGLALLGFGASGTWLGLFSSRLLPRFLPWCRGLTLGLAISATLCFRLAEILPLNIQYVLFSGEQLFYLLCYQALIFLPFLFAGVLIGLALIRFSSSVHLVYGANLLGSGAGPVMALGLMIWLPPARIIQAAGLLIWSSVFLWRGGTKDKYLWRQVAIPLLVGLLLILDLTALSLPMRIDPHKMLAELQRWEQQGDAQHLLTRHSPRGRLDVFSSPRLHYTLFAGLTATTLPPAQALLLVDGNTAGPIFRINDQAEAAILDHTPMSVGYRLLPGPKVLLLGETSGVNIWLARRYGASQITVVMENPQILDLFRGPLADLGGQSLKGSDLKIEVASPRHYLEYSQERFDLIQVVSAESMAAGVSNLLSLHENYLFTVEGLARCLQRLTPIGLLSITRGLQSPPRDNIKILATLVEAMEKVGIPKPSDYLAQLRNHLAVCTLAARQPFQPLQFQALVQISDKLWLDIDTLAGFDPSSRKPFNQLVGPPGSKASFFQLAANKIFSADREAFIKDWAYNVRPATDDRPYFFDFFRWRSLPKLIKSYGNLWFQRLELGYVILVISLVQIVTAAIVLLLLPLFIWTRQRARPWFPGSGNEPHAALYPTYGGSSTCGWNSAERFSLFLRLWQPLQSAMGALTLKGHRRLRAGYCSACSPCPFSEPVPSGACSHLEHSRPILFCPLSCGTPCFSYGLALSGGYESFGRLVACLACLGLGDQRLCLGGRRAADGFAGHVFGIPTGFCFSYNGLLTGSGLRPEGMAGWNTLGTGQ